MSAAQLERFEKIWPSLVQIAKQQAEAGKIDLEALKNIATIGGVEAGKLQGLFKLLLDLYRTEKTDMLTKDGEVLPGTEIVTEEGDTAIVPNWKTPWNHNTVREAARTALVCLTQRRLNNTAGRKRTSTSSVDRFLKTGLMPTVTVPPSYGDFSTADDYHALQNRIAETNALFYKLPAAIRAATRTTLASGSRT